jgi:glycosyltransferase involved in cell wall biosynthesis
MHPRTIVPTATRLDPHPPQPDVSVIVALPDHQGLAIEYVQSLVRKQTYSRERFEVIVVTDGSDSALDRSIQELLGHQDRMISYASSNLFLLGRSGIVTAYCSQDLAKWAVPIRRYDGATAISTGNPHAINDA